MLIYVPNSDFSEVQCIAACEVVSTDPDNGRITFDMRPIDKTLVPSSRSRHRWVKDPFLPLNISRIHAYGILNIFAEAFHNDDWKTRVLEEDMRAVFRPDLLRPTLCPQQGEVYLFASETLGTKIGKSIDVGKRKKEVERDIGESVKVLHRISSNDYSRAEFTLHLKYGHLRHKGEWFNLSTVEIGELQQITEMNY
jgi:hypothetical protein